ncbi:UNVERIFIED_CONTAM: hypothetical protein K2H54_074444, partial [Gekko kuhli]
MLTEDRDHRRPSPASGAPEHGEKAAAEKVEPQAIAPEASGARPMEEQRQEARRQANPGGSTGAGPDERMVPAGPRPSPHDHVVQDGAAEVAAGAGGTRNAAARKGAAKKVGAKAAAKKKGSAPRKDGRHKGPACPSGSESPTKRPRSPGPASTQIPTGTGQGDRVQPTVPRGTEQPIQGATSARDRRFSISSELAESTSSIASLNTNEKEEGEWSGDETETKPTSSRLFQPEHFQRLLTKVVSTLNYQLEEPDKPRSSASAKLDPRGFKKPVKVQTFSPFPDYFVIREEWANPGSGASLLSIAKRFYSLPEETMEDLKVPLVDAPVVALHSGAVLPKDGENALKDPTDRKNETALKKAHEAMSLAIRSAAALSNFTRATAIWADNLLQDPE